MKKLFPIILILVFAKINAPADTVAFFYALDKDFQTLKAEAQPVGQPLKVGSRNLAALQIGAHRIYAVKMGSGAVETAASAQALLARVPCDRALSVGPVGMIADSIQTNSWYRVTNIVCYQKGSWSKTGFQLSPNASLSLTNQPPNPPQLPPLWQNAQSITVASGEIFLASDSYRMQLHDLTQADAVDMNLFGLATVCADHQLPLTCWRIASDRADDQANETFRKFVAEYDGAGGKAVAETIKNLPANPNLPEAYPNIKKLLAPANKKPSAENR
jgi:nucleoside phosphorylase